MVRSRLLDHGREYVDVYPEILQMNSRGVPKLIPSTTPTRVRVTTSKERSQIADLPGQVEVEVVRCIARSAPIGTWSRVVYQGKDYDLASPPRFSPGDVSWFRKCTGTWTLIFLLASKRMKSIWSGQSFRGSR